MMIKKSTVKISVLTAITVLFMAPSLSTAAEITVATAAGYKKPMNEVYTAFTDASGIKVESAFGNIKQIEAQAKQNPDIQMLVGDWDFIKPMGFSKDHQPLPQVSTYVLTGEVDAGFVNLSEAMSHANRFSQPIEMPQSCYRPIDLSIVPIDGRTTVEGQAFLDFLASDKTKEILKRHGL